MLIRSICLVSLLFGLLIEPAILSWGLVRTELEDSTRGGRPGVVGCDELEQKVMKSGRTQKILTAQCNRLGP